MLSSLEAEREVNEELEPGETLVWSGKPIPARAAWSAGSVVLFLFAVVWTGFAVFWVIGAAQPIIHPSAAGPSGMEWAFPFFGAPFILIGLGLLSTPYWNYKLACQTVYAITNKRLLIISGMRTRNVQSINPEILNSIDRNERSDGTGDLIFNSAQVIAPSSNSSNVRAVGFYGIAGVKNVETSIRNTFPKFSV